MSKIKVICLMYNILKFSKLEIMKLYKYIISNATKYFHGDTLNNNFKNKILK
jgi:hypothetical protein